MPCCDYSLTSREFQVKIAYSITCIDSVLPCRRRADEKLDTSPILEGCWQKTRRAQYLWSRTFDLSYTIYRPPLGLKASISTITPHKRKAFDQKNYPKHKDRDSSTLRRRDQKKKFEIQPNRTRRQLCESVFYHKLHGKHTG